ncbi:MAG: response regulator [Deltaproteobacteria bacterium]|nr:response regulator [Deltaproteobacteria bacterium]
MDTKTILLVEDNEALLKVLSLRLSKFCHLVTASNGMEAWDILKEHEFDFMVTDIEMPVMNGFELINKVREAGIDIKIIVVSGRYDTFAIEDFQDLGITDCLEKPYSICKLLDIIGI